MHIPGLYTSFLCEFFRPGGYRKLPGSTGLVTFKKSSTYIIRHSPNQQSAISLGRPATVKVFFMAPSHALFPIKHPRPHPHQQALFGPGAEWHWATLILSERKLKYGTLNERKTEKSKETARPKT